MDAQALVDAMPLAPTLGVRAVQATAELVVLELDARPELATLGGNLHGGALMALADCAGGGCAYLNLPEGAGTATIDSTTSFLAGVPAGATVTALAVPLKVGRTVVVVRTDLTVDGQLVATTTQSQAVLAPRP